jgi:hypothetical protein
LRAHRLERRLRHAERPLLVASVCERGNRRDAGRTQPLDLALSHPGDEPEVVVALAHIVAFTRPHADRAVRNLRRIHLARRCGAREKRSLEPPIIRGIVVEPKRELDIGAEQHVRGARRCPL